MIVPNQEYRINPKRSIYVQGEINQNTLRELTPQILSLKHEGCDPITVFIDSPGGSVFSMLALLRLLKADNQDGESCRIITVATGLAENQSDVTTAEEG